MPAKTNTTMLSAPIKEANTKTSEGDFLGAMQVWSRVIQLGPDKVQGYLHRAQLKRHIGDAKGAVEDLDAALKMDPNNFDCLVERAALKRRANDYRGALDDLSRAIEIRPARADSYVERGWLKMALNDFVGSFNDYHTAVTLNPALKSKVAALGLPQNRAHIDFDAANALDQNDNAKGENNVNSSSRTTSALAFSNATAGHYTQAQLARLNNAAAKQINENKFEEAIKTLNELISAAPDYAHARDNLTIAHNNWGLELAKRTPALAAKQFRQALYLDPSQGASRRNLDAMIREIGKDPKNAEDRLVMANESLAATDNKGAFVEATEAARLKNTAAVRAVLKKVLAGLDEKEEAAAVPVLGQLKPVLETDSADRARLAAITLPENSGSAQTQTQVQTQAQAQAQIQNTLPITQPTAAEMAPPAVIEQAKSMAQAGKISGAEDLLNKLINDIKARAAVNESSGFDELDQALETLADLYLKSGSYVQAEANLSELVSLRETAKDRSDPILGSTYSQYAKVLGALNRPAEAKLFQDKAAAILDNKSANH